VKKFPEITDEQLETKIAQAAQAYKSWKKTGYAERAASVAKAAELMHADVDKFAKHATIKRGTLINDSRGEGKYSVGMMFINNIDWSDADQGGSSEGGLSC